MRRKFLFLIVAMVIIASLCVFAACDNGDTSGKDGGTCGTAGNNGETYILPDGVYDGMTVSGGVLMSYSGDATELVIPNGVTSIGEDAFYGCIGLTSITIPNSVTNIGFGAFSGCGRLTSITIPNSVINIGFEAFSGCSRLTSIMIPDSVTSIGSGAFSGCGKLTSITIPNSVISIGYEVFCGCDNLQYEEYGNAKYLGNHLIKAMSTDITKITIKSDTKTIASGAFENCSRITSIMIPDSVTSIGDSAFSGCSVLTSITTPAECLYKSKLPLTNIKSLNITRGEIPDEALKDCTNLTSLTIGEGVTSIGDSVFSGCSGLTSITTPVRYISKLPLTNIKSLNITRGEIPDEALKGCTNLTNLTIGEGVTSIGYSAFKDCSGLTSITIPDSVTSIGSYAFYGCRSLQYEEYGNAKYLGNHLIKAVSTDITEVTIKVGTKTIAGRAFDWCRSLKSITIPDSVTSIGDYAFYGCSSLTSITIPDGVTSIGSGTFSRCYNLRSVKIGKGVMSIGSGAFLCYGTSGIYYTNNLKSITVASGNTKYHSSGNCLIETATKTLVVGCQDSVIPTDGSVTSIGASAFEGCVDGLTSITIPDSVTSIGDYAFYGCSGLTSITIPDSVTSIGASAFEGCSRLTSITIPDSVTSIGEEAFRGCSSLTRITIPSGVTSIGYYAFRDCSSLTIYAEATTKPDGWESSWNDSNCPVVWGYKG